MAQNLQQQTDYDDSVSPEAVAEAKKLDMNEEQAGSLAMLPPAKQSTDQPWREWVEPVTSFLSELPDYVGNFVSDYRQPLLTVLLLLSGLVTVKVTLAVLDAINDIPLLAPVFELVGIGYSAWFVYRYLLQASTRKELGTEFQALKGKVVGKEQLDS
ncbi:MAG: CAAD domain-containing protein [Kastovskya adunca ATA6-11-RM4]|jgi:hypothetical protein|nr:CAAD domain-containing protein [Kastovskya adunca ATA6-11-RM4]